MSKHSRLLSEAMAAEDLHHEVEFRFHPERRWRWDIAIPMCKLAIEVDGRGPGHTSDLAIRRDMEKANAGVEMGWRVLRYPAYAMTSKPKLEAILSQISRLLYGVEDEDEAAYVLTTHPIDKL